jgi:hypothetical protein
MPTVRTTGNTDGNQLRGLFLTELLKRATEVILHFVRFRPVYLAECAVSRKERHCLQYHLAVSNARELAKVGCLHLGYEVMPIVRLPLHCATH